MSGFGWLVVLVALVVGGLVALWVARGVRHAAALIAQALSAENLRGLRGE